MLSTSLALVVVIALGSIFIYLGRTLIQTQQDRDRIAQALRKYESLTSREETENKLDSNIQLKQNEIQELDVQHKAIIISIQELESKLRELETKEYLISIDEYEPKYDFVNSGDYLKRLEEIKLDQKRLRDNNQAFICDGQWSIGEGRQGKNKGKKMVNNLLKMIEVAFEQQCEYIIKEARYNNVDRLKQKIEKSFDKINKYVQPINCRVSAGYLKLKLIELDLKCEFKEKEQEDKDRERAIKEQMKQEKKDRLEIETAQQEAEEAEQREKQYLEEIERKRQEKDKENLANLKFIELEQEIKDLEKKLAQATIEKEKAIYRSNKLKSGYIYVLSNIGSLEEDMYRIFMTKSSDPDTYIGTMRPYVPFPFDVHYKIFSTDASGTLQYLHQQLNDKKVNLVNDRREFFKVSFDEIEKVIQKIDRETGTLTIQRAERVPDAYEYRRTQAAKRRKSSDSTLSNLYVDKNEIA